MRFVHADDLEPGMILGRDIISSQNSHMLRKGVTLTVDYVIYIQVNGYAGAYIVDDISEDITIEENTVSPELFTEGVRAIEEGNVGTIMTVASDIAEKISSTSEVSVDLMDLRSYDDYTYHHSVNVAIYATVVGKRLMIKGERLNLLCQAGLCHDLGKTKIPLEILNKPGRLTDEEYTLMKNHPRGSYDILSKHNEMSALVKQAVIMHHENENGTGYPFGKVGDEIPIFAKIIHIVDVYDALTSRRPYKDPYSSKQALEYIKEGSGVLFDKAIVDVVLESIPAYPAGIDVSLSNGQKAIVVSHSVNALRPKVKIYETGEIVDLLLDDRYADVQILNEIVKKNRPEKNVGRLNESRQKVKERKQTIVIVDDVKMARMQAEQAITGDYNIVGLESGLELINYLERSITPPDLVILDIEMPLFNGVQTAEKLRKMGYRNLPIMFLTGTNNAQTILDCKRVGAVDYVLKPCKPIYLNERVEVALGNSRD